MGVESSKAKRDSLKQTSKSLVNKNESHSHAYEEIFNLKRNFAFEDTSAFIPDLFSLKSEQVRDIWSKNHRPLREYECAVRSIALEPFWLPHTRIIRHINDIKQVFRLDTTMESHLLNDFTHILNRAIEKAYPQCRNPSKMKDILTNCNIYDVIMKCYNSSGWRKPYFAYSLKKFTENVAQDTLGLFT